MKSVPTDWERVPIKELYLGLYDGPHATPKPASEGPVFLGIKNITDDGHLDFSTIRHIAEQDYPNWIRRVEPQPKDIVFTYEATLNRYAIIPKGFRGCLGRRVALIRPNPERVDHRYLYYYFFGADWRRTIEIHRLRGATVDRIPLTSFPNFEISLPPLPIQRRIADILSAYDALIENNARRIAILEEMAQTIYREWFVHFRFPGHEAVRMVAGEDGVERPEGWGVVRLGEVAVVNERNIKRGAAPAIINYVDIASVSTGSIDQVQELPFDDAPSRARRKVKHGDIIWSSVRPNRRSYSLVLNPTDSMLVSTGFSVLTATQVPYTYLYQAVTTDDFVEYLTNHATGAAYPAVNAADFENARLLLPEPQLLEQFHVVVDDLACQSDVLHLKNANLRTTRDLLLPKLVAGEIEVGTVEGALT